MGLEQCTHCHAVMLRGADGRCPACRKLATDPVTTDPIADQKRALLGTLAQAREKGILFCVAGAIIWAATAWLLYATERGGSGVIVWIGGFMIGPGLIGRGIQLLLVVRAARRKISERTQQ